jgi:hypothetical protein
LELGTTAQAYAVLWLLQTNVLLVCLDPGFNGTSSLPSVNLTTFAGYAVNAWSLESQVILHGLKETGNLPGGGAKALRCVSGSGVTLFSGLRAHWICQSP